MRIGPRTSPDLCALLRHVRSTHHHADNPDRCPRPVRLNQTMEARSGHLRDVPGLAVAV